MTVDEMKERWVHQDDIEILRAIYKNEMTVAEFIEAQEDYIYELSNSLVNLQEEIYDLVVLSSDAHRATRNEPLLLSDIKKD
ncbi:hypothetical protein [Jeotgalibaca porci]|uniref:hypothetical protein n=1 Tax=Jeotgalibaca porci TaxID=1868793 RepID=UPI0035A0F562